MFTTQLLPAIRFHTQFLPGRQWKIIKDNAKVHLRDNDPVWWAAADTGEYQFNLINQPPRSPDCNICDLSICNVLQTIQQKFHGHLDTPDGIIQAVNHAWLTFEHLQLEKSFCTLQRVHEEIILSSCDNTYVLPHMGKDKIIQEHGIHYFRIRARHASAQAIQKKQDLVGNPV